MFACVCPSVTVNKQQCFSMQPHGAKACQHSQPQLPKPAPCNPMVLLRRECYPNTLPCSPSLSRSILASRPINLSTLALQQQMGCRDLKATFIIILGCTVRGFTAIDASAHIKKTRRTVFHFVSSILLWQTGKGQTLFPNSYFTVVLLQT